MNIITIDPSKKKTIIHRNIYGHFIEHLGRCVYDGIWVGENAKIENIHGIRKEVVDALRKVKAPVIRWPGGCFADEYHWKDGIGPKEKRKKIVNTHWGGVVENNHFGTHEFMEFCELIGASPYICGNVGSGTVREMQEWIEYLNGPAESEMGALRTMNGRKEPFGLYYFGVGNENWGCGGRMRAEHYADLYKQYQHYVKKYGNYEIFKIACGPRNDDYCWTEVLMREASKFMDGLSLHYYTRLFSSGENKTERRGNAVGFDENDYFTILKKAYYTNEIIHGHKRIMDKYDPEKRVALVVDEWGTWYDVEKGTNPDFLFQQNTIRDALVAGISLNIFNNHSDRVRMANIAQTVNVLQALLLTKDELVLRTPTYHVFDMYRSHQDATLIETDYISEKYEYKDASLDAMSVSASVNEENKILVTVTNIDPKKDLKTKIELKDGTIKEVMATILKGDAMDSHNTFENRERLIPQKYREYSIKNKNEVEFLLPSLSVLAISMQL